MTINWLKTVCRLINHHKLKRHSYFQKSYFSISLFFVAARFSNQEIDNILMYGDKFIKRLKY